MTGVLDKMRGGDLRSIGKSNDVVIEIKKKPSLIDDVFGGLNSDDPVLKARCADVIEKATRGNPELLTGHKKQIISMLKTESRQEVCWHLAQLIPRLQYTSSEEFEIFEVLKRFLSHKSKIVRVCAMESMVDLTERNHALLNEVTRIIRLQVNTGSPAVQARGRNLLKRIDRQAG